MDELTNEQKKQLKRVLALEDPGLVLINEVERLSDEVDALGANFDTQTTELSHAISDAVESKIDGRNPMHVGKKPPTNPQKGDLWYKD